MKLLNSIVKRSCNKVIVLAVMILAVSSTSVTAGIFSDAPDIVFPSSVDAELQAQLELSIAERGLKNEVNGKRLSVTLVDITDIENPRLAHVNGFDTFYAASLPKLAIMLAVFEEIHQGKLELTEELDESLRQMIQSSSNVEATRSVSYTHLTLPTICSV